MAFQYLHHVQQGSSIPWPKQKELLQSIAKCHFPYHIFSFPLLEESCWQEFSFKDFKGLPCNVHRRGAMNAAVSSSNVVTQQLLNAVMGQEHVPVLDTWAYPQAPASLPPFPGSKGINSTFFTPPSHLIPSPA